MFPSLSGCGTVNTIADIGLGCPRRLALEGPLARRASAAIASGANAGTIRLGTLEESLIQASIPRPRAPWCPARAMLQLHGRTNSHKAPSGLP
jgi:hypothetical protein